MKTFLEDLGRKIGETAEIVTSKAGEAVEIQKLRNQIRALERACERDYMDLGRTVYEHYKEGEVVDAEAIGICEAIQHREESIGKYEQQVSELKGDVICDGCCKTVAKEMSYCPYCGTKVPEEVKEEAPEADTSDAEEEETVVVEDAKAETADETQAAEDATPEAVATETEDASKEQETVQTEEEIEAQIEAQIEESIDAMKEKVVDMAGRVREKTEDAACIVRDKTVSAAEAIKEKVREAEEKIKSMTEE